MGIKLEDLSPLAAMMTGKGAIGKAMRDGFGGMIPQAIARGAYEDEEEKRRMEQAQQLARAPAPRMAMKKGGSASSRADGIAKKGKTRGKMV